MEPANLEKQLGMRAFLTKGLGIGGRIKSAPEDFVVKEVLIDGSVASVDRIPAAEELRGKGRYLLCLLVKKGLDTLLALKLISKSLGLGERRLSVAGLKDANAVTFQFLTIDGLRLKGRIALSGGRVELFPIKLIEEPLTSSFLLGNRFTVTVRDLNLSGEEALKAVASLMKEIEEVGGVPNFFGHQRFGTIRPVTHVVGKYIVKRRFKEAVLHYLCYPSLLENPKAREARVELLETLNFAKALKNFPANLVYERSMIKYLVSSPNDYVGALKRLPSRLRLLFVNAYQAFLFNEILSERMLSRYPLNEALEGDWVVKLGGSGLAASPIKASANNLEEINDGIKGGRFALALPVVGYGVELSGGAQGDIEKSILRREGVTQRDFYVGPMPEASSAGSFRTALTPVKDVKFKLNDRSITFTFFLLKGSYATAFLREIMKPKDPVKAGF